MIRVGKPAPAPNILRTRGAQETRAHEAAFDADPQPYLDGAATFDFNSGIYGADSVKNGLIRAQHGKCCFCESEVRHISYGDVEHFRPKKGYRQAAGDALGRPGYYWLAYDWSNLFLACQMCNQRFKGNLFPLETLANRAVSHTDDIADEDPLFLHPQDDEPEAHISFREHVAVPANGSERGDVTIRALGLNRPELRRRRHEVFEPMSMMYRVAFEFDVPVTARNEARDFIERAQLDESEYAAMARAAVEREFEPFS